MVATIMGVIQDEHKGKDLVEIPFLNQRMAASVGAHLINIHNLDRYLEPETRNTAFYDSGELENFRLHIVMMAPSGFGKCLPGSTMVEMADGSQKRIDEFIGGEHVLSLENLKIEEGRVLKLHCNGKHRLNRLTTRSGRSIQATSNHLFMTMKGWVPLSNLRTGDRIAVPRTIKTLNTTSTITKNTARLLGYMCGDGCCVRSDLGFTHTIKANVDELNGLFSEYSVKLVEKAPIQYRVAPLKKWSKRDMRPIYKMLKNHGMLDRLAHEKSIPKALEHSTTGVIAEFLNRYMACDGWLSTSKSRISELGCSTASPKLAKGLMRLFLRCGIFMRYRVKKTDCRDAHTLSTNDAEQIRRFIEVIGIRGKERQCLKALRLMDSRTRNVNLDVIEKQPCLNILHHTPHWLRTKKRIRFEKDRNPTTGRDRLLRVALADGNKDLKDLATSDLYWDEIVDIHKMRKQQQTYDLEIDKRHNFVADLIVVHNSTAFKFMLHNQRGLLRKVEYFNTSIRGTFSPESWAGTATANKNTGDVKMRSGIFSRFKRGIVGADEFMRFVGMMDTTKVNEYSNEEVYLLTGLDSDTITKDLSVADIDEQGIGTTLWAGSRIAQVDPRHGLARRVLFQIFTPTPSIAKGFRRSGRSKLRKASINESSALEMNRAIIQGLCDMEDIREFDYGGFNEYMDRHYPDFFHAEEQLLKRIAVGYTVARNTLPDIVMDEDMVNLLEDEIRNRYIIRRNPVIEVVKNILGDVGEMSGKDLVEFLSMHYQFGEDYITTIIRQMAGSRAIEKQGDKYCLRRTPLSTIPANHVKHPDLVLKKEGEV